MARIWPAGLKNTLSVLLVSSPVLMGMHSAAWAADRMYASDGTVWTGHNINIVGDTVQYSPGWFNLHTIRLQRNDLNSRMDTVWLRDGSHLTGEIFYANQYMIEIQTEHGRQQLNRLEIRQIELGGQSPVYTPTPSPFSYNKYARAGGRPAGPRYGVISQLGAPSYSVGSQRSNAPYQSSHALPADFSPTAPPALKPPMSGIDTMPSTAYPPRIDTADGIQSGTPEPQRPVYHPEKPVVLFPPVNTVPADDQDAIPTDDRVP